MSFSSHHHHQAIIIGSGPGGAVTAWELVKAGLAVLVLEEGPSPDSRCFQPFSIREATEYYRNGGLNLALGRVKVPYVEGRVLGGGSEINAGLFCPAPERAFESWGEYLVQNFEYGSLLNLYKAFEDELDLRPRIAPGASSLKLMEGARNVGLTPTQALHLSKDGKRQTMASTYLAWAQERGAKMMTGVRAEKIEKKAGGWKVHAKSASGLRSTFSAQNLFLCGGAVQTPLLMRRSAFRGKIGDRFQVHPVIKVAAKFPDRVNSLQGQLPLVRVASFPDFILECSISSPQLLAMSLLNYSDYPRLLAESWEQMALYSITFKVKGRGKVRNLFVRHEFEPSDYFLFARGLKEMAKLLLAAGAEALYPAVKGIDPVRSAVDIEKLPEKLSPRQLQLTAVHLFSGCAMGENEKIAVSDSFGKVRGVDNLYIADASLFCASLGENPQATVMALARRNAEHFLNRSRSP